MNTITAVLTIALSAIGAFAATEKPNIVYILADDLGYADVGFNGGKQIRTPELDKLAREGVILKDFYVQPCCSATRAVLMTGRHPMRTGLYGVVNPGAPWGLKLEERTLADALRDAGYETAICGKWHLGEFQEAYRPTKRGFDHQYGLWFGNIDYFTHQRNGRLDWHRNDQLCYDEGYSTHLIAKEACRIIREKSENKPLFLYVPFNAVHGPHQVPEKYLKPYAGLEGVRLKYAGMTAAMDEAIGQIVTALDETGIRNDTLVIFSSDNGGPKPGSTSDNTPLRGGKASLYEGGLRACAFATWPGSIPGGQVIAEPLHGVDWYPTLVKLAGGSLNQKLPLDGKDIWPVLTEGAESPHDALPLWGMAPDQAAIRMGDWKLLVHAHHEPIQLYNLANDMGEKEDLSGDLPEKVKELRDRLDEWLSSAVPNARVSRKDHREKNAIQKD